jgi:excinuclease ABC subunit C
MSNEDPHDEKRVSRSAASLPGADEDLTPAGFRKGAAVLQEQLATLPASPGVYRMMSETGEVLYIGKARALKKRVASYTQWARQPVRTQRMVSLVRGLEITLTHTEAEALLLEANLIRHHQPPFNILLRDDKSYACILLTRDHDFPQALKYRGARSRPGWYYGPFASADAVNETMTILMRGFMLRNCSDSMFASRKRPCLQYHIRRCTAPCVGRVTKEEYAEQVKQAREFLTGKDETLLKELQRQMEEASVALDYEEAAQIRDRIKVLSTIHSKQSINYSGLGDADVVGLVRDHGQSCIQTFFFRNDRNYGGRAFFPQHDDGASDAEIMEQFLAQFYSDKPAPPQIFVNVMPEDADVLAEALSQNAERNVNIHMPQQGAKTQLIEMALHNGREALARRFAQRKSQDILLEGVARVFGLEEPPQRIEVYDNSHVSGTYAVGAMIVAGPEGFMKKAYRKFNIKNTELSPGDDVGMMREVLRRRFARALSEKPEKGWDLPDLVLIDGGQGQLNAALETLADMGLCDLTVVGIAKGEDRNAGRERFFRGKHDPFSLEPRDPVLYFLQRLRDEAHRFAIGAHRNRRAKAMGQSPLDGVPGIGPKRRKQLLLHFGSGQAVAAAGLSDLARAPGISAELARKIYDYFHEG